MTLVLALVVPDGIALVADTWTTRSHTVRHATDKSTGLDVELREPVEVALGGSHLSQKLFGARFAGRSYAIGVAGTHVVNHKTVHAIIQSLELHHVGSGAFEAVRDAIVSALHVEMRHALGVDDLATAPQLHVDLLLACFADGDLTKPILCNQLVFSGTLAGPNGTSLTGTVEKSRIDAAQGAVGVMSMGRTELVSHLVNHPVPGLPPLLASLELMSLADAVDCAKFLVRATCEYQRFAPMVPDCGLPMTVVALTPEQCVLTLES
jgi:hypothetical protein